MNKNHRVGSSMIKSLFNREFYFSLLECCAFMRNDERFKRDLD